MDPENKIFKKMEKTPEDIIILQTQMSHMIYGSSDMECNGQRFFVILPLKFEKIKKHLEILSFYKGVT